MHKNELRQKMLQIRKKQPIQSRIKKSNQILKKLLALKEFKKSHVVLLYISLPEEVDTHRLIKNFTHKKQLVAPISEKNSYNLDLHEIVDITQLQKNWCGILEPINTSKKCAPREIELVIVPGVAFDEKCNRLGFGKGCYDNLLKEISCPKIGLAYDFQIVRQLPLDEHDQSVDMIITEKRIIKR